MIETATDLGRVRGQQVDDLVCFKGIPYAAPPEGALRFEPPAPAEPWTGVRDCLAFGAAPPQLAPAPGAPSMWRPGDGLDCLTLNVWSPDVGGAGLPVMVWIYGGLWKHGASGMPQYDAARLAAAGVVVVTVNYRVGFEGFGHLPGKADNRGLRDQVAALEWVRRNIAAFGGNPDAVTVFGQSAGAASIALLAGKRLFQRAIVQSIPGGIRDVAEAEKVTAAIAAAAGVPATVDGFAGLPPEAILAVQDAGVGRGMTAFGPVVDGDIVTGPTWSAIAAAKDVDLICGCTHEEYLGIGRVPPNVDLDIAANAFRLDPAEYRRALPGRTDDDLFVAMASDAIFRIPTTRVAEAHSGRTWLYDFAWRGPLGAAHGVDVPFTFGLPSTRFAARFVGSPPPADFEPLSAQVRAAWTDFAKTGDPGWPTFDVDNRQTRIWETEPRVAGTQSRTTW